MPSRSCLAMPRCQDGSIFQCQRLFKHPSDRLVVVGSSQRGSGISRHESSAVIHRGCLDRERFSNCLLLCCRCGGGERGQITCLPRRPSQPRQHAVPTGHLRRHLQVEHDRQHRDCPARSVRSFRHQSTCPQQVMRVRHASADGWPVRQSLQVLLDRRPVVAMTRDHSDKSIDKERQIVRAR